MVGCGIECNTVCNAKIGYLLFCQVLTIKVGMVTDFYDRKRKVINDLLFIDNFQLTK